jgi:hypothetical protein
MNKSFRYAAWMLLYLMVVAVVVGFMWRARQRTIALLENPRAKASWQEWQGEARRQSEGDGPVARKMPQTDEPPELVLLRDYFATSLAGVLMLTSAIFIASAALFRGMWRGPRFPLQSDAK